MKSNKAGQIFLEYSLVFAVLAAVIVWTALNVVKPAANRFYNTSGLAFDKATVGVQRNFPTCSTGATTAT